MNELAKLQIRQLDDAFKPFTTLRTLPIPRKGWIKAIREALGMSIRQLANRTGLSKTSVASIEKFEAKGTVQLDSVRRLAEALDCDFVYALIPKRSLGSTLETHAESKARKLVGSVSWSMELEEQGISSEERDRQIRALATEMLRNRAQEFWDE